MLNNTFSSSIKKISIFIISYLFLIFGVKLAFAQTCTFTGSDINFGNVNLLTNAAIMSGIGGISVSCTGTPNQVVRICINIGYGSAGSSPNLANRYLSNGANLMTFSIYTDAARTQVWGSKYTTPTGKTISVLLTGTGIGTGSSSVPLYGLINPNQSTLPTGAYSSSFAGNHIEMNIGYSTNAVCGSPALTGMYRVPINVLAQSTPYCTIATNPLDFGPIGLLNTTVDAATNLTLACSNGIAYTLELGLGTGTGVSGPTNRKMNKATESVVYGLYKDAARAVPWGLAASGQAYSGTGSGLPQNLTVYGRTPTQTTPSPGVYSDTVVVTVTY